MKKIFSLISLFWIIILLSQNTLTGTYRSKKGSLLKINSNNTFFYQKESMITHDVVIHEIKGFSLGKFKQEKDLLVLQTIFNQKIADSIINKGIRIKEERNIDKDSVEIILNPVNNMLKVFICGTGIEYRYNNKDFSGCYLLKDRNIVPVFSSKDFYFRIYPNIDNPIIRSEYHINTMFFDTKKFSKNVNNNLEISIVFDLLNFSMISFDGETVLIGNNKLSFLNEDFFKE